MENPATMKCESGLPVGLPWSNSQIPNADAYPAAYAKPAHDRRT
jgi:hypothetical protein